jgi:DNA ligase 1
MQRRVFLTSFLVCASSLAAGAAKAQSSAGDATRPSLMLANVYDHRTPLAAYWVSEKYDGVRGYWNGHQLLTRGGEVVHAPAWFTAGWPDTPMDGELWAGRGRFSHAVSTARQQTPDDAAWRDIRFMVFDLPAHTGTFTERILAYQHLVSELNQTWLQAVPQWRVDSHAALRAQLNARVKAGAEGLMLHLADAPYRSGRSDDLLKVKLHADAEARVVAHVPGQGKHVGRLGALLVETPEGMQFKLGTGFTDAQRASPPPVGAQVTYRYRGLNDSGMPRFASFWRVREE